MISRLVTTMIRIVNRMVKTIIRVVRKNTMKVKIVTYKDGEVAVG